MSEWLLFHIFSPHSVHSITILVGKRQTRIFRADLSKHLATLPGQEANVLLTNQTTLHGYIQSVTDQTLLLRDLRQKDHPILLDDIEEIMLDREAAF